MANINCWDFKKCGREIGGIKEKELGVCPAATFSKADGFLGGKNAGKACAYVSGTFCGGTIQGTVKDKTKECVKCDFYKLLRKEHGMDSTVVSFSRYVNNNRQ